jgi:hypothetical protein
VTAIDVARWHGDQLDRLVNARAREEVAGHRGKTPKHPANPVCARRDAHDQQLVLDAKRKVGRGVFVDVIGSVDYERSVVAFVPTDLHAVWPDARDVVRRTDRGLDAVAVRCWVYLDVGEAPRCAEVVPSVPKLLIPTFGHGDGARRRQAVVPSLRFADAVRVNLEAPQAGKVHGVPKSGLLRTTWAKLSFG